MQPEILTENLSAGYGKKIIADNININVNQGEILTLIGPNGAGKSTVLKSISAQLEPIGGAVYIDGKNLSSMSEKEIAKKLSVMMTERMTPELMSCREVIETGRYPYTGRLGILSEKDHEKVNNAMELVRVQELENCDFSRISDGQRQRVMLARAVCQEADIIILDEPTSFLDIRHKLELLTLLKKLVTEQNKAVIMSLHELELAQKISDRIICIKDKKTDRCGTPEEIFTGNYISSLYNIEYGSFNDLYGSAELSEIKGSPEIFVIGGGGNGIAVYRKLQRMGIPFAAGIIHENDIEYPAVSALACETVTETAFEPISRKSIDKSLEIIGNCRKVICCIETFGTMNAGNKILRNYAEKSGKLTAIGNL